LSQQQRAGCEQTDEAEGREQDEVGHDRPRLMQPLPCAARSTAIGAPSPLFLEHNC